MDNKQLIDTVFSLSKLHGYAHKNPNDLNKYRDGKFFNHFFREILQELLGIPYEV